jgi:hypothetical protein
MDPNGVEQETEASFSFMFVSCSTSSLGRALTDGASS